jgi:predicted transcriptional regulator YdeE
MEYTVTREKSIKVIGIAIRTTNQNKRAMDDIAALWKRFEDEDVYEQIPNKISENILSIYTDYEYDFTRPYTYMIACPVANFDAVPEGMIARTIPTGNYMKFSAKGKMPDELLHTWNEIWKMQLPRSYRTDFEVYHVATRGKEFEDYAEIDVMIGSAI